MNTQGSYKILLGFLAVAFFSFAIYSIISMSLSVAPAFSTLPIDYQAQVCVYKTPWLGDRYGETQLVECSHNVLYDSGKNMTRDMLAAGGGNYIRNISLCNSTVGSNCSLPVAAASENYNLYTNCGMGSKEGTYSILPAYAGNWTISNTFTSSCDNLQTNSTRLMNASSTLFAGNMFTTVTLQTNDQLTVNWTISIS